MSKFKECPFCGGESYIWKGINGYKISCNKDCVTMPPRFDVYFSSEEEAIRAWNTRTDDILENVEIDREKVEEICNTFFEKQQKAIGKTVNERGLIDTGWDDIEKNGGYTTTPALARAIAEADVIKIK